METTLIATLKADPRWNASGVGATDEIMDLLSENLDRDLISEIGLRRNYLCNTDRWRPSDALRQAVRERV